MKKILFALSLLLFLLQLSFLLMLIPCGILDLHISLTHPLVLCVPMALLAAAVLLAAHKAGEAGKAAAVLLALSMPLSIIDGWLIFMSAVDAFCGLLLTVAVVCCLTAGHLFGSPKALKKAGMWIVCLVFIPLYVLLPLVVGGWGKNTVVQTLDSPSGAYYAEHSNTDLGVSGGKTYGHICQDKLDLGFLKLTRREMVYYNRFGGQSEPDVLQMYWEDDSRLIINGWAYDNPLDD